MDALGEITNLKCSVCEQQFLCDQKFLEFHQRIAHSMTTTLNSPSARSCNLCGKTFSKKDKVLRHYQIVHLKMKPHKCHICNTSFGLRHNMKRHMIRHNQNKEDSFDNKPMCNICNTVFKCNQNVKNHIKMVHLKIKP